MNVLRQRLHPTSIAWHIHSRRQGDDAATIGPGFGQRGVELRGAARAEPAAGALHQREVPVAVHLEDGLVPGVRLADGDRGVDGGRGLPQNECDVLMRSLRNSARSADAPAAAFLLGARFAAG